MKFESRELKPYGEFVKSKDLVKANVYFYVSFFDQDMLIPELIPVVFIGRNLQQDGPGLYFQDFASYMSGQRYNADDWTSLTEKVQAKLIDNEKECRFDIFEDSEITSVFVYEKALDQLLRCSIDRKKAGL